MIGLLGEAGCHLALRDAPRARDAIHRRASLLSDYVRSVFARTVGDDAARFLCPGLAQHGVTLEFLAELFRQASHAGATAGRHTVAATDLIEEWRGRLHIVRDPWRNSTLVAMRADLAEAVAAVEEVNRVNSFASMIDHFESQSVPFTQVMNASDARSTRPEQESRHTRMIHRLRTSPGRVDRGQTPPPRWSFADS